MKDEKKQHDSHPAQFQVTQKVVIYRTDTQEFLTVRRVSGSSWDFVGGRVHDDEPLAESLKREIEEEVGSSISYELVGVVDTLLKKYEQTPVTTLVNGYLAIYSGGEVCVSDEHDEYRWETAEAIEKNDEYPSWMKQLVRAAVVRIKEREYLNDLQRLQADFANYKKRQQESQKELAGYLIEKLVMEITPVLDNFQMATAHVPAEAANSPWVTGIQYIEKQLEKVLEDNGMQVIAVKEGDVFDPSIHEAISEEKSEEGEKDGAETKQIVKKILQKGYKIGEKVIRPAKVVVG